MNSVLVQKRDISVYTVQYTGDNFDQIKQDMREKCPNLHPIKYEDVILIMDKRERDMYLSRNEDEDINVPVRRLWNCNNAMSVGEWLVVTPSWRDNLFTSSVVDEQELKDYVKINTVE